MPAITCGGMRFQQAWEELPEEKIDPAGQANLEATVRRAVSLGINHFETARGYGTSEVQLGRILPELDRESILVQTKIGPRENATAFLDAFETSMRNLGLEYVDLLAVHGINLPEHLDCCLRKGGTLDAIRRLQREGRVRFCGFSTHAGPEVVVPAIETGEFDYVNLHWYYVYDPMHRPMIEAAAREDMGVLLISPNDKGGVLYRPPEKLRRLCMPLTPMQWHDLYCLARPEVHTLSVGAARPEDFDEHVEVLSAHWPDRVSMAEKIERRLRAEMERRLGREWVERWHEGLPHHDDVPGHVNVREILRLWTFHKGLDLTELAKMRYNLLGNAEHWFPGEPAREVAGVDWSCLSASPFAGRIPDVLEEAHALFHEEKEAKRLGKSREGD